MPDSQELQTLKIVSRVKHRILKDYLVRWSRILGSSHLRLGYVDCFAGGGLFKDETGKLLPGSPIVALQLAKEFCNSQPGHEMLLEFVEENRKAADRLRAALALEGPLPRNVKYDVKEADAQRSVEDLIDFVRSSGPGSRIIPTFFFVDPYGHPITIPTIRDLLSLGQTEIFVNLMWFQISRNLNNPKMQDHIDRLFGHSTWRDLPLNSLSVNERERTFVQYFCDQVGSTYDLRFAVKYSPEDKIPGREHRTKFYLLHFSKHPSAALKMKEVMFLASDNPAELQFSGREAVGQLSMFTNEPDLDALEAALVEQFAGRAISFDDVRLETLDLPFIEKHYRQVIKSLSGRPWLVSRFTQESRPTAAVLGRHHPGPTA
jgi:three-Cys-motif partner protein